MSAQVTDTLLMIRPAAFGFNEQTAANNVFQRRDEGDADLQAAALEEFNGFVGVLLRAGVRVLVFDDKPEPVTPDAIFPNNWFSTHADGRVFLYPLFAENRRGERRLDLFYHLGHEHGMRVGLLVDLSPNEVRGRYLEGTGSMVFDRDAGVAYACLSPRTDRLLLEEFCALLGLETVVFGAVDARGHAIYHTNVMMHIGSTNAVVALDSIRDEADRDRVRDKLEASGKTVIPITPDQVVRFAGNMLEVRGKADRLYTVMSTQARDSLDSGQIERIEAVTPVLHAPLDRIERAGGGSARCMMAEIFLPKAEAKAD